MTTGQYKNDHWSAKKKGQLVSKKNDHWSAKMNTKCFYSHVLEVSLHFWIFSDYQSS